VVAPGGKGWFARAIPNLVRSRAAFSDERTREEAVRAIEDAFAVLEHKRRTPERLSDLADAIDALNDGAWAVAVALAEASTSKHSRLTGAARPAEMSRSWEELKHDFEAATKPAAQLIPVVDANLQIIGWTAAVPNIVGVELRHPEAERIVGGRVVSRRVELVTPTDIARAGGPKGWRGPWVCLALCKAELQKSLGPFHVPRVRCRVGKKAPRFGRARRWFSKLSGGRV
jgi:hypothetical protein